jgi:RNA polymerase sigma-70 factor (ECF subfamily)
LAAEDNKSFVASVVTRHGRRLRRFLAQRLRNRADAPDLAQEVYLRLLRVERHEEIRSSEAYVLTIASNLLREHAVRQAAMPPLVDIEHLATELLVTAHDDPVARAESEERLRAVERALAKLPPKAQAVLLLHRRDGIPLEEIGKQLGVSRSMAKKYLMKALSHCRQRLERMERT